VQIRGRIITCRVRTSSLQSAGQGIGGCVSSDINQPSHHLTYGQAGRENAHTPTIPSIVVSCISASASESGSNRGAMEIEVISSVVWSGPWPNGKAVFETWNNKAEPPPHKRPGTSDYSLRLVRRVGFRRFIRGRICRSRRGPSGRERYSAHIPPGSDDDQN
jgi:hypothetical protein